MAYADNTCRTGPTITRGDNVAFFKLTSMHPYYSIPVNGTLGSASLSATLTCYRNLSNPFVLQVYPASPPLTPAGNVCQTPLDGVGIRYLNNVGKGIPCNAWDEVFRIPSALNGGAYPFTRPVAAEFVRVKAVTSLPSGSYTLQMPAAANLQSHLSGVSNSAKWGHYQFSANIPLVVSTCTFANSTQTVDFKKVNLADLNTISEKFDITLNMCTNLSEAQMFNDAMYFKFQSTRILANGTLANDTCTQCAKNLAIAITTDNGTPVPLNQTYRLKNGTSTLAGGTITHHFRAKLVNNGGNASTGTINAVMTVVFSAI